MWCQWFINDLSFQNWCHLILCKTLCWIHSKGNPIIAAPDSCQSLNSLVEHTWPLIVCIAHAYIMEKQMGHLFWFYAIKCVALIINQVSGHHGWKLNSLTQCVHSIKPDSATWFKLFSVGYFTYKIDGNAIKTKIQSAALDGIEVWSWLSKYSCVLQSNHQNLFSFPRLQPWWNLSPMPNGYYLSILIGDFCVVCFGPVHFLLWNHFLLEVASLSLMINNPLWYFCECTY